MLDPQATCPTARAARSRSRATATRDDDTVDPPDTGEDSPRRFTTVGVAGLRIHDIQGAAHLSPYEDDIVVEVPGVVTAVAQQRLLHAGHRARRRRRAPPRASSSSRARARRRRRRPPSTVSGTVSEFRAGCEPTCARATAPSTTSRSPSSTADRLPRRARRRRSSRRSSAPAATSRRCRSSRTTRSATSRSATSCSTRSRTARLAREPRGHARRDRRPPRWSACGPRFGELPTCPAASASLRTPRGGI